MCPVWVPVFCSPLPTPHYFSISLLCGLCESLISVVTRDLYTWTSRPSTAPIFILKHFVDTFLPKIPPPLPYSKGVLYDLSSRLYPRDPGGYHSRDLPFSRAGPSVSLWSSHTKGLSVHFSPQTSTPFTSFHSLWRLYILPTLKLRTNRGIGSGGFPITLEDLHPRHKKLLTYRCSHVFTYLLTEVEVPFSRPHSDLNWTLWEIPYYFIIVEVLGVLYSVSLTQWKRHQSRNLSLSLGPCWPSPFCLLITYLRPDRVYRPSRRTCWTWPLCVWRSSEERE